LQPNDEHLLLGTYGGDLLVYGVRSGQLDFSTQCHSSALTSIQQRDKLVLTSSAFVRPYSMLWRMGADRASLESLRPFEDDYYVDFTNTTTSLVVGTQGPQATVYDTETGARLSLLYDEGLANHYVKNRACFNPTDDLVLNDGILWDLRCQVGPKGKAIHKFDKLNPDISGVFHANGAEMIINSEVVSLFLSFQKRKRIIGMEL